MPHFSSSPSRLTGDLGGVPSGSSDGAAVAELALALHRQYASWAGMGLLDKSLAACVGNP